MNSFLLNKVESWQLIERLVFKLQKIFINYAEKTQKSLFKAELIKNQSIYFMKTYFKYPTNFRTSRESIRNNAAKETFLHPFQWCYFI